MEPEHPEKIGDYEILGIIGKGAMGRVYKGTRPSSKDVVAIKVLPPEFLEDPDSVERFEREAQAVALLDHPNVVKILEKNTDGDQVYFVMEFVAGTPLDAVLGERRLSLPEAFRVFRGVCAGLDAAHQKSVVHRDLSPKNILVSEDLSVVKIADFGISRVETISSQQGTLSTTEFSLGSLHYIAPEQARNMVTADHRADIYSLGVLLYEMLTGRVPVGQFNLPSQLNSEVPHEVDPIVLRCLEVDAKRRYPTVRRLLQDIERVEDQLRLGLVHEMRGLGSHTSRIFTKSSAGRSARLGLLAAGVLVLLVTAFLALRGLETESGPAGTDAAGGLEAEPTAALASPPSAEEEAGAVPPTVEDTARGVEDSGEEASEPETAEGSSTEAATVPATGTPEATAGKASTPRSTATAPPSRDATESQELEIARKKFEAGLHDEALADINAFIAEFPDRATTADAYLLLGEIHQSTGESEKARAAYIELRSRFSGGEAAIESLIRSARILMSDGGREGRQEARAMLAQLAEQYPKSQWAAQALIDKATLEIDDKLRVRDAELGDRVPAALITYRELVAAHPEHPGVEEALWNLGEMYADLKEFQLAASTFEKLGKQFPGTRHDAWWNAGQIYDRRLDRNDLAIAAYRKVPSSSRHHDDAQRRISKLSR